MYDQLTLRARTQVRPVTPRSFDVWWSIPICLLLVRFRYGWDGRDNTPVHQAALYVVFLESLLLYSLNIINKHGHAHVMELFMKKVTEGKIPASDLFVVNIDQNTPLHLAVSRLNVECVKHILTEHINQR